MAAKSREKKKNAKPAGAEVLMNLLKTAQQLLGNYNEANKGSAKPVTSKPTLNESQSSCKSP